ncbi:MAG TPA: hypothetical protein VHB77_09105, partial [Planctomycetaceae bacterium]|nr:hypothetical protein [Planctomycetaceae bacterium]
ILYAAALNLFVFAALVVRLAVPLNFGNPWADWAVYLVATLLVAVAVGVTETTMARLRLVVIPRLLAAAGVLAALGLLLMLSGT